jgi:hypothetical protein
MTRDVEKRGWIRRSAPSAAKSRRLPALEAIKQAQKMEVLKRSTVEDLKLVVARKYAD